MTAAPDKPCPHEDFEVWAEVGRLTDGDDGPVGGYSASIKVNCAQCQEPFRWIGLQAGLMPGRPMVSVDETELRAPIRPASSDPDFGLGIPGFAVTWKADLPLKQGEWYGLCKREQGNGGEVVGVTLTPRSAQELVNEVSAEASAIAAWLDGDASAEGGRKHVVAGARVGSLVNWAAKTVIDVDVDPDSEVDIATVRYVQTRTVVIGAA